LIAGIFSPAHCVLLGVRGDVEAQQYSVPAGVETIASYHAVIRRQLH